MHPIPFRHFVAACTVAVAAASAFAAEPAAAADKAAPQTPLLIVEDTWIYMVDEPGLYFDQALADLRRQRPQRAANDLRKAAALLDHEASRVDTDDAQWALLERDASTLLTIARLIDAGALVDMPQLDRALSVVRADLGALHAARASTAWLQRDIVAAGQSLGAAARYVSTALTNTDETKATGLRARLVAAENYGESLARRGAAATAADWDRSRAAIGQGLEALGHKIEPASSKPQASSATTTKP